MPNSRELKKLLKPLLLRRPDLAFERRMLFFRPLTHYLRGVAFVVKGYGAGDADAVSFAGPLFDGQPDDPDFYAGRTGYVYRLEDWQRQDFQTLSYDFSDRMEREALPMVEKVTDPRNDPNSGPYSEDLPKEKYFLNLRLALGACYYGDYDRARDATAGYDSTERPTHWDWPLPVTEEFKYHLDRTRRALYLAKMLRENEAGISQLLHDWEKYSVETSKLTKYWKPTPFPCESRT